MGAIYTQGFTTVAAGAAAAYISFNTQATRRARIIELALFVNAATASSIGLIRPNNTPVVTGPTLVQALDPNDPAGTVQVGTVWSTAPTVGANLYLRKGMIPATIGNGLVWPFADTKPLILNVSSWLVLWNFGAGAGSVLNGSITLEEN